MIQQYYMNLNKSNGNLASKRSLETIFRLAKDVAKLKLKYVIDSEDVIHATKFYQLN